jgi:Trypsin-like peptidase domain/Carboxypeptidase regulatory-like domain
MRKAKLFIGIISTALLLMLFLNAGAEVRVQTNDPLRVAAKATIRIITGGIKQGEFRGQTGAAGVIISAQGLALTTRQAIIDADGKIAPELWAMTPGAQDDHAVPSRAVRLKVVAVSQDLNLALLKLAPRDSQPSEFPFIKLDAQNDLYYGSQVTLLGFSASGGMSVVRRRASVVDFDCQSDSTNWIVVDGGLTTGGPVINDRGELAGLQTVTRRDMQIPFFGDEDYPLGLVEIGEVGYARSAESLIDFLLDPATVAGDLRYERPRPELRITGKVKDKKTGEPIPGAVIGIVSPKALTKAPYITASELVGHARSDFRGAFEISRRARAGRYLIKIVHPQYQSLVKEIVVDPTQRDFTVELVRN